MATTTYVIEGGRIGTLEDFRALVGEAVNGPGGYFGRNLDSFADCLRGGFGTPDEGGFVIEWRDHELSRRALGHPETARRLEGVLERRHPTNRARAAEELARARAGRGPTLFDVLTEIIDAQAPGALRLR
ncbi:barstar family protein [Streptomyces vinaceus]|uniref:barstar family protein n=1 Tax=Streptomyces vinaceus TaxID=1960 RepID=UPI003685A5B3